MLRCRHVLVLVVLVVATAVAPGALSPRGGAASASAAAPAFDTAPARASLERLLSSRAQQFSLVPVERTESGDWFAVSGGAGRIQVRGTSPATLG
ncbi:alpha-N-acetylglucosaminidase N-terminal domain-containing protein [Streptomyces sp. NPDC000963]